jgi:hypothetical protein
VSEFLAGERAVAANLVDHRVLDLDLSFLSLLIPGVGGQGSADSILALLRVHFALRD